MIDIVIFFTNCSHYEFNLALNVYIYVIHFRDITYRLLAQRYFNSGTSGNMFLSNYSRYRLVKLQTIRFCDQSKKLSPWVIL